MPAVSRTSLYTSQSTGDHDDDTDVQRHSIANSDTFHSSGNRANSHTSLIGTTVSETKRTLMVRHPECANMDSAKSGLVSITQSVWGY